MLAVARLRPGWLPRRSVALARRCRYTVWEPLRCKLLLVIMKRLRVWRQGRQLLRVREI